MWEGDLAGNGIGHVFGSTPFSEGSHGEATATRTLFTADGNLFFNEVSERNGTSVEAMSVITGGTGIFKYSTGMLSLTGTFVGGGEIEWAYSGSITLQD